MSHWFPILTALWMSGASAQFGFIKDIQQAVVKEAAAIKDPLDKTAVFIGFSQCGTVKKIFGVDYGQYNSEPDLTKLELEFITPLVKFQINLTALPTLPSTQYYKPGNGLIIYLHGFTDDPSKGSYKNINEAFLQKGAYNILALDASSLIRWLYLRSSTMVRFIGDALGEVIAGLTKGGLNLSSVHLIGHSLGSHIAGFAGKTVYRLTGQRVGRISGLDPAGPCFSDVDAGLRLNKNDADFVDVIHTDAGVYGINELVGHVDFFPNRGSEQPNCLFQTCSHSRAWELYAESISNTTGFPAVSCASWKAFQKGECDNNTVSYMGFGCSPSTRGMFALQTADTPPYALGAAGISHTDKDGIVREIRDHIGLWRR
ncbi:pancreatic triacylglycerol lipase-like [Anticarsia gemmatalis]|uniref:pancreatic triacylglycerol lipase-like n=1 Tax=Anticarsia gemmatalis TaxID=129554 RepID=UPI003F76FF91